jgi:hypothetical protein
MGSARDIALALLARSVRDTGEGEGSPSVEGGETRSARGLAARDGEANLRAETPETSGSSSKSGHRSSKKGGSGALEPSKSENATLAIPVTPATPATPTPASVGNKRTTHASSSS